MSVKDLFSYNIEERPIPQEGLVSGTLPAWLSGTYYKLGNGKFTLPSGFEVNHVMDGYTIIYEYVIENNKVTFRCKYLNSDAYKEAMKYGKPTYAGIATRQHANPDKNILSRMVSSVFPTDLTDNNCSNIFVRNGYMYALADNSCYLHQIDPVSLQSVAKLDLKKANIVTTSSHYLKDKTGAVYNAGVTIQGATFKYALFKVKESSPDEATNSVTKSLNPKKDIKILTILPSSWTASVTHFHSFGMSENYFIIVEPPVKLNAMSFVTGQILGKTFYECCEWLPEEKVKFFVIDRATNKTIQTKYFSLPFHYVHIVNAYEEEDCLIIDIIAYEAFEVVKVLMMETVKNTILYENSGISYLKRFVMPINNIHEAESRVNLVKLSSTKAMAVKVSEDLVLISAETLFDIPIEFPTINDNFVSQKYRYIYTGVLFHKHKYSKNLLKLDLETKEIKSWSSSNSDHFVSEPTFVPNPEGIDEDDGIVISAVVEVEQKKSKLIFLDGKSFTEIARAEFNCEINTGNHSKFIFKN